MSNSAPQPVQILRTLSAQPFRLDVLFNDLPQKPPTPPRSIGRSTQKDRKRIEPTMCRHLAPPRRKAHAISLPLSHLDVGRAGEDTIFLADRGSTLPGASRRDRPR